MHPEDLKNMNEYGARIWSPGNPPTPPPAYKRITPESQPVFHPATRYCWLWDTHPWMYDRDREKSPPKWDRITEQMYFSLVPEVRAEYTHYAPDSPTAPTSIPSIPDQPELGNIEDGFSIVTAADCDLAFHFFGKDYTDGQVSTIASWRIAQLPSNQPAQEAAERAAEEILVPIAPSRSIERRLENLPTEGTNEYRAKLTAVSAIILRHFPAQPQGEVREAKLLDVPPLTPQQQHDAIHNSPVPHVPYRNYGNPRQG